MTENTPRPASLTQREIIVLKLVADQKTTAEIARILRLKESTIKRYLEGTRTKLGVTSDRQAVARAITMGLIGLGART